MNTFVEEIYQGFMVRGELFAAFNYLKSTNQGQLAETIEARLSIDYRAQNKVAWLDPVLNAYWDYLQATWQEMWRTQKAGITPGNVEREKFLARLEAELQGRLSNALELGPELTIAELEADLAKRLRHAGLCFRLGKTGGLYGPYIWQNETVTRYQVAMPHSVENMRVHFMRDFLFQGPYSILFDNHFSVSSWGNKADLYCVAELFDGVLTQPKFQISFLKHETQHQLDSYFRELSPVHLEYRAKLVELMNYSDTSFLRFLLVSGSLTHRGSFASYAAALVVKDVEQFLTETGVENVEAFINELLEKPLEWMRSRGRVQQAALAVFDRDTRKILDKEQKKLPEIFL